MSALLSGVSGGWPVALAALLVLGAVLAGLSLLVGNRLLGRHQPEPPAEQPPALPTAAVLPPPSTSSADHRQAIRTGGTWVKVVLVDDDAGGRLIEAHVVDYTTNGVGIMLFQPFPVGKVLRARHAKAPGDVPWVRLEVRSCQQLEKTIWKLGCHADDVTLWDTLMRYS